MYAQLPHKCRRRVDCRYLCLTNNCYNNDKNKNKYESYNYIHSVFFPKPIVEVF